MKTVWLRINVCLTLVSVFFSLLYFPVEGDAARRGGRGGAVPGSVRVFRMARPGIPRATMGVPASRRAFSPFGLPMYGPSRANAAAMTPSAATPYGIFTPSSASYNPFWTGSAVNPFTASSNLQNPFAPSVLTQSPFTASAGSVDPFATAALPFNPFAPSLLVPNPFLSSTVQALVAYAAQMTIQQTLAMAPPAFARTPFRQPGQADLWGTAGMTVDTTGAGLSATLPGSAGVAGDASGSLFSSPFVAAQQNPWGGSSQWPAVSIYSGY